MFNDLVQHSKAPDSLKSPMLYETTEINGSITIDLQDVGKCINSIGIGNTDGTCFIVNGNRINFAGNGLYMLKTPIDKAPNITIHTNARHVGRIGAGFAVNIPTSVAKEPGFHSTSKPRTTLSGQVVPGIGGHNYKTVSLDSRYKIDETVMNEIKAGSRFIGQGYPFFIDLGDEASKLPFDRMYATERNQMHLSFESGVNYFLYSRRWEFEERF